jgi:type I restriction enzyme M protein
MIWKLSEWKVEDLFTVKSGDFHAMKKELDLGEIPLISCGDADNGFVGNFDIPENKRYRRCLTVAYNGQPLMTKFHPYEFGAKDDVAVLIPKREMRDSTLLFIAAFLNRLQWRYSYGRKCFRQKLRSVEVLLPATDTRDIDAGVIAELLESVPYWDFVIGGKGKVSTD